MCSYFFYFNITYSQTGLIRKMVQYAQPDLLTQLCSSQKENLGVLLVEVVAAVLDVEVSINFCSYFNFNLDLCLKSLFNFFNCQLNTPQIQIESNITIII